MVKISIFCLASLTKRSTLVVLVVGGNEVVDYFRLQETNGEWVPGGNLDDFDLVEAFPNLHHLQC